MEDNKRKEKKRKDRFSITILGVAIYSVLLIVVMAGSYVGVKAILKNNQPSAISMSEDVDEVVDEVADTEQDYEPVEELDESEAEAILDEEVEETAEDFYSEHAVNENEFIDDETGYIDYEKYVFKPSKRDDKLKWNDTVFSKIENVNNPKDSVVNTYNIKRVTATLIDEKSVVYTVYTNPQTEDIEKITEVEYCGDNRRIYDYYYEMGNINYIAQYNMAVEKPVPLTSADIESRYYFNHDEMVRFIYCGDDKATEYSVGDLKSYSSGTVEQYDFLEKSMLNRAYIVYNYAKAKDDYQTVYGYVMDEYLCPLDDVQIKVYSDADGSTIATTHTDGDGYYKFTLKINPTDTYTLTASCETLSDVSVYEITATPGSLEYSVDPIYMAYESDTAYYNAQILVRDAYDSQKVISEAKIKIRRGIGNSDGEVIAAGVLDEMGSAIIPMSAGAYTAEISKGGYETLYLPVNIRADHQAVIGFCVPDIADGSYKAVLSWETSPLDLDFVSISSDGAEVVKSSGDSLGITSAEVISLDNVGSDEYRFYVCDRGSIISGDAFSYNMTKSSALVTVYNCDGVVGCFHVPVASAGIIWEPFEIYNGSILSINNYYHVVEDNPIWMKK